MKKIDWFKECFFFVLKLAQSAFLAAGVIFLAENVGTFTSYWTYPNQINEWQMVPIGKFSSWFLLLIFKFLLCLIGL